MSKPQNNQTKPIEETEAPPALDFVLEETFPDATNLFTPNVVTIAPDGDFLVAIDTNVLILPYNIDAQDLSALSSTYRTLAKAGKLFLPARASREFLQHRDRKLADVVTGLNNKLSRLVTPEAKLSPILVGVEGYDELPSIAAGVTEAVKEYRSALQRLINKVKQWRGNDPVSQLYADVFSAGNIIEAPGSQAELRKEWATRRASKLPPGYQDAHKEDSGIGDFLIWKSLLEIGKTHQKDLVFLTLDDKSDWAVRGGQEAIYPRPELINEYRRASGGKSLYLSHLGEFLKKMDVSDEVVANVKAAEGDIEPSRLESLERKLDDIRTALSSSDQRPDFTSWPFDRKKAAKLAGINGDLYVEYNGKLIFDGAGGPIYIRNLSELNALPDFRRLSSDSKEWVLERVRSSIQGFEDPVGDAKNL